MKNLDIMSYKLALFFAVCCCAASSVQASLYMLQGEGGRYSLSFWEAYKACSDSNGTIASRTELEYYRTHHNFEECSCGWFSDHTAGYAMLRSDSNCGGTPGIHSCTWGERYNVYCVKFDGMPGCSYPLGIETGSLNHEQFSATSVNKAWWGEPWHPSRARLNKAGLVNAWMPYHDDRSQYVQVSFDERLAVSGILTQGASRYTKDQYVTKYKISYSLDLLTWYSFNNGQIFEGNYDDDSQVRNWFNPQIIAKGIRIHPYSWHHHICIRFEVFGCTMDDYNLLEDGQRKQKSSELRKKFE